MDEVVSHPNIPSRHGGAAQGRGEMSYEVITGDNVTELRRMAADTFDLCVTSPPYDNLRTYKGYSFDFEATAKELYRVIKPGGVVVWVVADATVDGSETGTSFRQALFFKDVCGFNLHDTMIYRTNKPPLNGRRYESCWEFMFVFSKGTPKTWNPLRDLTFSVAPNGGGGQRAVSGEMRPRGKVSQTRETKVRENIWYFPRSPNSDGGRERHGHPATFPEPLARDHILSWSNEGDLVIDPFCGSGTTGKMAVIAKRNFVGIEISEEYAELSRARIARASGQWAEIPRPQRPQIDTPLFAEAAS